MKFIKHLPCPRCGSKDNLGEYEDHFFCFGCKYYKPKTDTASLRLRMTQTPKQDLQDTQIATTDELPQVAKQWLYSYGILPNEIKDFGICWNDEHQLLVLMKAPDYWQARCFGNQKVKYLSKGKKPLTFYGYSDRLVCVEDILSAIKISRLSPEWCSIPLLGSHMSDEVNERIGKDFKSVVIWLDRDKAKEAIKIANNLKQRGVNASVVISPKDPKEYTKGELSEWLRNR